MNVVCPKCSSQIPVSQPDSERQSSIRCPKCNITLKPVTVSPASEKSALTVGHSPSTEQHRYKARVPAPLFELKKSNLGEVPSRPTAPAAPAQEMSQLLANLLVQHSNDITVAATSRPAWNPRKVLVCTAEVHREAIAQQLTKNGYQVFVAQDTEQAVDRMRENLLEVVLLDSEFDSTEQGAAFVVREVNVLRPAQRRRLFFVLLSPLQRTMDAHAAFLHSVNAVVNLKEAGDLFGILEHALREYNELYKEFNKALNVAAL
jgi:CheY-like chemotaxis protein/DNA-directed RNA polymerase subunit RPC12/RpoP